MLTRQGILARTPAGQYSGKTIAQLKALAMTDPDAVWELRGRYQSMTTEDLRKAARSDALARQVAAQRRALTLTAVPDDPRWPGHQLPHEATAVSRDAQGNIVWRGAAASGNMTAAERALPFPQGMNASHTEVRLTLAGELPRGGTFRITGQYDPCVPCQNAMRAAAERTGCTIEYWWPGAPNGQPFVARAQGTLPPGTPPPAVRPRAVPPRTIRLGSVLRLSGHILLQIALAWASVKLQSFLIESKFAANVDPHVERALGELAREAEKLGTENPTKPVYLHVTVDTKMMTTAHQGGASIDFVDVAFVGPVTVGREKLESHRIVSNRSGGANQYGVVVAYPVYRVTYSIPIQFDESPAQHAERVENFDIAQQAEAGHSVRHRAESVLTHARLEDRYGERGLKERATPTQRTQQEAKTWAIRWTKKYIEYTKSGRHFAALHADAVRYLDELEGRAQPARWDQRFIDPAERRELEKLTR